jgi:hypothetical protein
MNQKLQSGQEATIVASAKCHAVRNPVLEAAAALNFWQALEYLAPQAPPDVKLVDCVWALTANMPDAAMPWNDPVKQVVLNEQIGPKQRFQIFSGIISGVDLIEVAREHLGAAPVDMSERPPPKSAACVMLGLNGVGMATGEVFVSTVPWAMARIVESAGSTAPINFSGFLGMYGVEQQIQEKVEDLLVELKLLAKTVPADESETKAPSVAPTSPAAMPAATATQDAVSVPEQPELRPVTSADIATITHLIFELSGWRPAREEAWRIKAFKASDKDDDSPAAQENPLNSFYAEDLERLSTALGAGNVGTGLREYLRGEDSSDRVDLERDVDALISGVHPSRQPPSCWPGKFPLVTAQQFAVNTIMRELGGGEGIFSVNGPPGTGKTTMLKDIVAAIVVGRAEVLAGFDNPASAFQGKVGIEDYQYQTYKLDERLRGFGIVVASANNGAVENISRELPGLGAIDPSLDVDYFSMVADSVAAPVKAKRLGPQRERWGLIAAVLGNKENRNHFVNRFWFAGAPPKNKKNEPLDPLRLRSVKELMRAGEHGAMSWEQARARYRQAARRGDVLTAQAAAAADAVQALRLHASAKTEALAELGALQIHTDALLASAKAADGVADSAAEAARDCAAKVAIAERLGLARGRILQARAELEAKGAGMPSGGLDGAKESHAQALRDVQNLREDHELHLRARPGLISQLFRTEFSRRWNARGQELEDQLRHARLAEKSAAQRVLAASSLGKEIESIQARLTSTELEAEQFGGEAIRAGIKTTDSEAGLRRELSALAADAEAKRGLAASAKASIGPTQREMCGLQLAADEADANMRGAQAVLDGMNLHGQALRSWDLNQLDRETMHSMSPYHSRELFEARRDLFVAAMDLHKAFIVASWGKLERTLSAFVNVLGGSLSPAKVTDGVAHLWDAFFLVVPLVSTTFASFPRLFTGIRREELAWLLIDEAGQATPQQAAGGIWRAKRSVVVGDPLQLEPVVAIPGELITPLLKRCQAEQQWTPPAASAQTLADRANRYGMYLGEEGSDDAVWLGSPLLVHRRCLDPMFDIANNIAYENKMVYGAGEDKGPAGIGPSRWIDMRPTYAEGHWIEAQGLKAAELVELLTGGVLRNSDGQFKVYVITPFRTVAQKMKALLYNRYKKASEGMAGTVHTFQGKEAEHVIFLLGGNPKTPGVIATFAGAKPNLVNVAVTRAKRRLYVIGDRNYWTGPGDVHRIFSRMAEQLEVEAG